MIYLIISSTGSYQLNSFNPHLLTEFSKNLNKLLTTPLRRAVTPKLTIEERIQELTYIHGNKTTFTYLPPVATKADLLTTYPELFI